MTTHEILPDGESTEKWAFRAPGFFGSINQILCCARCGEYLKGRNDTMYMCDMFKPTQHWLCVTCYKALPDDRADEELERRARG